VIENYLHGSFFVPVDVSDELFQGDDELLHFACQVRGCHTEKIGRFFENRMHKMGRTFQRLIAILGTDNL